MEHTYTLVNPTDELVPNEEERVTQEDIDRLEGQKAVKCSCGSYRSVWLLPEEAAVIKTMLEENGH